MISAMTSFIALIALTLLLAGARAWARRDRFSAAPSATGPTPIARTWTRPASSPERAARRHAVRHSQPA
jgi:hypothetical protein